MLSISSLLPVDQGICQYKTGHWLCCIKVGIVAHHDENCQPLERLDLSCTCVAHPRLESVFFYCLVLALLETVLCPAGMVGCHGKDNMLMS